MIAAGAHSEGKVVAMRHPDSSTWLHRWPDLFDGLTAEQRRIVITAVADNVLDGWRPRRADIQALVDVVCGNRTTEEYIDTVRTSPAVR
jgi:hypothetical protein